MGQARNRGSFESRRKAAIESGRVKGNRSGSRKRYLHHPLLGATAHESMFLGGLLAATAFLSRRKSRAK